MKEMIVAQSGITTRMVATSLALGAVQGLTEFLPVSSSGHLVVAGTLLRFEKPSLLFDVILHLGTLVAVLLMYRRELFEMLASLIKPFRGTPVGELWQNDRGFRLTGAVIVATVPTGIIGALFKPLFERLFSSVLMVGAMLMVTATVLLLTRLRLADPRASEPADSFKGLTLLRSVIVGLAQGVAITPGISRSGSTIATAQLVGIDRSMAARFSFLLSIPAILGAALLESRELDGSFTASTLAMYAAGAVVAAIVGYLALLWLVQVVRRGGVHWFSYYLYPAGAAIVIWQLLSR